MTTNGIHRRTFLRGAGGIALGLPLLEAMLPRSAAAAGVRPLRYVAMFQGIEQLRCIPSGSGSDYTLPPGLASLEGVRDHVSVVTGLSIPGTGADGITPPGGKANPHHGNIMKPLLTGYRSTDADHGIAQSATSDQIVAEVHGDTHFRSLEYRAQPVGYRAGSSGNKTFMAVDASASPRIPQASPALAYQELFTGFDPSAGTDPQAALRRLAQQQSVLDLVLERGNALRQRVGAGDRVRLERHYDEIRDLERRLAEIPDTSADGCTMLPDPGPDPQQSNFPNTEHGGTTGYSDEDARARIMVDLIHMAFVCDLTRVATLMITMEQSVMSLSPLWGVDYEMHDLTHNDVPNRDQVWNAVTSWHAEIFASLVQRLLESPNPDGTSLLDDTVLTLLPSGGPTGHGGSNMALVVAGRPERLRMGHHVVAPSGSHPSQVLQTAMAAVDVDVDFGELPGTIDALMV